MKKIIFLLLFILAYSNASILFSCGIIKVPAKEGNACFKQSDYNSCKVIAKKYADNKSCYWDIMAFAKPPVETKYNKKSYKKKSRVVHKRGTKRKRKHIFKHKKYTKKRKQKSYKKKSRVVHKRGTKRKRKRYSASSHKQKGIKYSAKVTKKIDKLPVVKKPSSAKVVSQAKKKKVKTVVDTKNLNKFF